MPRSMLARAILTVATALLVGTVGAAAQTGPWTAPDAAKAMKNPLPKDKKVVEQGGKVAATNCAPCHGKGGKGDGPAAVALSPKPADWTSGAGQAESDGQLFWKISNGRGPMPPWKHLPESERWAVIQFIRSLKK